MTGAAFHRGESDQEVGTPRDFLDAVEKRFGNIDFDLAATEKNSVVPLRYYGPGSALGEDALTKDWGPSCSVKHHVLWLNPPFADIGPWAAKCAEQRESCGWILMLVPASVGTNWWRDHVRDKAMIYSLSPRVKFVGAKHGYPKDLVLCAYGYGARGETYWKWEL